MKSSIIGHREVHPSAIAMSHDGFVSRQIGISSPWVQLTRSSCRGKIKPDKTRIFTLHTRQLQRHTFDDSNMVSGLRMPEKMHSKLIALPCQSLQPLSSTARKFQLRVPGRRSEDAVSGDRSRIVEDIVSIHGINLLFLRIV